MARRISRGLTMIEMMVALSILALLFMFVMNLLPSSSLAVQRADLQLRAESLAQSALEEQQSQPFQALVLDSTTRQEVTFPGAPPMETEIQIRQAPGLLPSSAKQILVTVRWTLRGVNREVSRSRVRANLTP